jgi:hypothetical protein
MTCTAFLAALDATLATLTADKVIVWSKVNDDRARLEVIVTAPVGYAGSDPNGGYDDETRRAYDVVEAALAAHDIFFSDGGVEEDGSGEYWIFRAVL